MAFRFTAIATTCALLLAVLAGVALPPSPATAVAVSAASGQQDGQLRPLEPEPLTLQMKTKADQLESTPDEAMRAELAFASSLSRVFRSASSTIEPSVIHIQTARNVVRVRRDILGRELARKTERINSGVGSGVIVTGDGYALTNHHVIDGADEVLVTLSDGRQVVADVVGSDPGTDLAVLYLDAEGLTPATIADSDELQVGDWVVAVGSPFGLDHTVTAGIVSAKGRSVGGRSMADAGSYRVEEFIQTDAAINPGNSGGPLVNLHGQIVGINSMIATSSGGSNGIGFAIPSSIVVRVYENLRDNGRLEQGYLGVELANAGDVAAETGMPLPLGVFVERVYEGGPAQVAGLQVGDVITTVNGRPVESFGRLRQLTGLIGPGEPVELGVDRSGEELTVTPTVTSQAEILALRTRASREELNRRLESAVSFDKLGITGLTVDEFIVDQFNLLDVRQGVIVNTVEPDSPAAALRIGPGDVIMSIDGRLVANAEELLLALTESDLASGIGVKWKHGGMVHRSQVKLRGGAR
ncbi:MAG: trypsin-like peptidase domain-containing protein [Planctomycetota bacterium]